MNRRDFLTHMGLSVLFLGMPSWAFASPINQRRLILVELQGGNDGLNTIIPFNDKAYYQARPQIAIPKNQVLKLNKELGFHPNLKKISQFYGQGELAIIEGVGYKDPVLSHFRSGDIWDTASESDEVRSDGWLVKAFDQMKLGARLADAIVIGAASLGPLRGKGKGVVTLDQPERFLRQASLVQSSQTISKNPALQHILNVQKNAQKAAQKLQQNAAKNQFIKLEYPRGAVGQNIKTLFQILQSEPHIPVFKITLGGFDTHTGQSNKHGRLMKDLDSIFSLLRQGLKKLGMWDQTLILTTSEFGRRVDENKSAGTDHGTANVLFASGGQVRGGLYGHKPSLQNLNAGNLKHSIDFQRVYRTVLESWFSVSASQVIANQYKAISFLKVG